VLGGALLDAARIAGVVIVDLLLALAAGEHHLVGVDDDDVVAAIDVGRVARLVLAAQAHGDDRGEAADDKAGGVDDDPLLVDVGGFQGKGFHRFDPYGLQFGKRKTAATGAAAMMRSISEPRHLVNCFRPLISSGKRCRTRLSGAR
jgi:hypothetical protein